MPQPVCVRARRVPLGDRGNKAQTRRKSDEYEGNHILRVHHRQEGGHGHKRPGLGRLFVRSHGRQPAGLSLFGGYEKFNAYSEFLHHTPSLLWGTRFALLGAIVCTSTQPFRCGRVTTMRAPQLYAQRKDLAANYAALTMRYGGLILSPSSFITCCT